MNKQNVIETVGLYFHSVLYLKPSQIYYRCKRKLKLKCGLGVTAKDEYQETIPPAAFPELDFDHKFLQRFSADELLNNRVTFLHITEPFGWCEPWERSSQTPLWNFNLHYFEYLFPLLHAFKESGCKKYLDKAFETIHCWIAWNKEGYSVYGWHPYTTAIRLTNWLGFLSLAKEEVPSGYLDEMIESIHRQYVFLSNNLEKDLLGNHYFEDLKAIILCALFFNDEKMLRCAKKEFRKQCHEQFLPDGMHFELSPMYHCVILEGLLRVCISLRNARDCDLDLESFVQPAVDAARLGSGAQRLPLFNDGGDNVAKSVPALLQAAKRLHIFAKKVTFLPNAGYYSFRWNEWTLIVDAGRPGAKYNGGHVHCDALSYELFYNGEPVIVNCGTWLYQCEERSFFRSTEAHNTVRVDRHEQSECWGSFRLARRSCVEAMEVGERQIIMRLEDFWGANVIRTIKIDDQVLSVTDSAPGHYLESWIHFNKTIPVYSEQRMEWSTMPYAPEYGLRMDIPVIKISGDHQVSYKLALCVENEYMKNPI